MPTRLRTGEPYARASTGCDASTANIAGSRRAPRRCATPTARSCSGTSSASDIDGEVRAQEELRLAQESLARASQAASLAELSASIAHEVNQPLAAIVANSHACQRWLTAEPPNVERAKITAERIIRDANAAADVVSRIRALFKQSAETRTSRRRSTASLPKRATSWPRRRSRRRVRIDIDVESRLPPVAVDRVQIQQVLINLMRNGMEAMEYGRRRQESSDAARAPARRRGANRNQRSRAGVELPDRIFEPFFTTKEQRHGHGAGDLPFDRRVAWRAVLGREERAARRDQFIFTLPVATEERQT